MADLQLGGYRLTPVVEIADFALPLAEFLPDSAGEAVDWPDWIGPETLSAGRVRLAIRSWLLRGDGRTILVDTCVGADKHRPNWPDWHRRDAGWLGALAATGCRPEDVDIVLCTHLHADHVGWNTRLVDGRWVPTFPRARTLAGRIEYEHWAARPEADKHGAFADSVLPVMQAGRIDLVEDGWEMGRGLTLTTAPGHSPGHLLLDMDHGDGAVLCGDVIHTPLQLHRPSWSSAFDTDPAAARASRRALLDRVADTPRWLVPAHFADPGWMRIAADGAAYRPA